MPSTEPGPLEIAGNRLLLNGLLSSQYKRYVRSLGLGGGERVLDLGSGSGAAAKHLAPLLQRGGGTLTCVDISPRWLAQVRRTLRRYPNVEYRLGRVDEMDLPDASEDVIFIHWALHDVPAEDRPSYVSTLARLLRPGGRVFIREPSEENREKGLSWEEIRSGMEGVGLRQVSQRDDGFFLVGPMVRGVFEKP
jgi:ubiquinone/menaquinone biosynthesis C-methylase UbiE